MTPERWQKIHALFDAALQQESARREAYLDAACAGDPGMRAMVADLLAQDALASRDGFLATPLPQAFATAAKVAATFPEPAASAVRYRPLRLHARGGLGEVYLARDE